MKFALNLVFFFALAVNLSAQMNYDKERQQILDIFAGEWLSHCLYTATKLEIGDHLNKERMSIGELAEATKTQPDPLYRLMRTLASRSFFYENSDGTFSHTNGSLLLTKNHPDTLYDLILFYGEVIHPSWHGLISAIQTGKPGFETVYADPAFVHFQKNPNVRELFHKGMAEKSKAVIQSSIAAFDFSRFQTVYDIGGGNGHFLWALMEVHPNIEGILFDLPEVIQNASKQNPNASAKVRFIGGNFFTDIPSGGDAYILKSILHDWNDQDAQKILECCHRAMNKDSRLLIVEPVMLSKNEKDHAKIMDILMMNVTGGRERTLENFREVLKAAGFQLKSVYPTSTEFRLLEAKKS